MNWDWLLIIGIILGIAGIFYLLSGAFLAGGILITLSLFILGVRFGWFIFFWGDWDDC